MTGQQPWFSRLQPCWDSISAIAGLMGGGPVRSLVVCKRLADGGINYSVISPSPVVEVIGQSDRVFYTNARATVEVGDFRVYISRKYQEEQLFGDGMFYLIDADISSSPPLGGIEAYLVAGTVVDRDELFWRITLRQQE